MRHVFLVLSVGFWLASTLAAVSAEFQAAAPAKQPEEIQGIAQKAVKPIVVCPPRFSTPLYVPAHDVLSRADLLNPRTPEGWIITNRPVASCANCVGGPTGTVAYLEHSLRLRQYDSQIRLLQAEIASWQRKQRTYQYFNKAGALPVTVENTRLNILGAQEQLQLLRLERQLYIKNRQQQLQLQTGVPVLSSGATP